MYAFDLIELSGEDLRREPLERRRATLDVLIGRRLVGIRFNEHIEEDGPIVFKHVANWGLRASSQSARTRTTFPGVADTGSNQRIRMRRL
jgi:hypothetical protein